MAYLPDTVCSRCARQTGPEARRSCWVCCWRPPSVGWPRGSPNGQWWPSQMEGDLQSDCRLVDHSPKLKIFVQVFEDTCISFTCQKHDYFSGSFKLIKCSFMGKCYFQSKLPNTNTNFKTNFSKRVQHTILNTQYKVMIPVETVGNR